MKPAQTHSHLALVTVPDRATAQRLAKACLEQHLVACANILPGVESVYWWQGKIESEQELLILFKTTSQNLSQLQDLILREHPYDVPEFISFPIDTGSPDYLSWIQKECSPLKDRQTHNTPQSATGESKH